MKSLYVKINYLPSEEQMYIIAEANYIGFRRNSVLQAEIACDTDFNKEPYFILKYGSGKFVGRGFKKLSSYNEEVRSLILEMSRVGLHIQDSWINYQTKESWKKALDLEE